MTEPLITPELVRLGVTVTGDKHAVIAEMATAPLEHRPHHRHEVRAGLGQHVLVAYPPPRLPVGTPDQQPGVDQFGKSRRGRRLTRPP